MILTMLVGSLPAVADQIRHPEVLRQAGVPPKLAPVRVVVQTLVAALTWWATRPSCVGATKRIGAIFTPNGLFTRHG